MSTTEPPEVASSTVRDEDDVRAEDDGHAGERVVFVDAATRVSTPSAFDSWYYGIEDKLGQGTIGMGVCLVVFLIVLLVAITCNPI